LKFLLALQFLTRIPVKINGQVDDKAMAESMSWYPVVGFLLGGISAALFKTLSLFLPTRVCDLAVLVFIVFITGNIHIDGLMDTADGIFSGRPRERMLEIMKDSRVGSHGVMAGVLAILAKFILLGELRPEDKLMALIIFPMLGRWSQAYCTAVYPYARPEGGTGGFTEHVGISQALWASLATDAGVFALLGSHYGLFSRDWSLVIGTVLITWVIISLTAIAVTALLGRYISGKLGGMTGDTFGAVNECIEVMILLVMVIIL
jgi:adenosylcobinamide-GDP ribazoletransferase